jgi:hypothetical protein
MKKIKLTLEYGEEKKSWTFTEPIKFTKEMNKLILAMAFAESIAHRMMADKIKEVIEQEKP